MSKLYSYTYMSLDGVIDSPEEWSSPFFNDEMAHDLTSRLESAAAMVLGRVAYEEFAAFWPRQSDDVPLPLRSQSPRDARGASNAFPKSPERVGIHSAFDCAMPTTRAPKSA